MASGRTWEPVANEESIRAALAKAQPGDTVYLPAGAYTFPLSLPPGVHVRGPGPRPVMVAGDEADDG